MGLTLTTVTPVTVLGENPNDEVGGGIKSSGDMTDGDMGKTPGGVLELKWVGGINFEKGERDDAGSEGGVFGDR
jgi:hypothetical protein